MVSFHTLLTYSLTIADAFAILYGNSSKTVKLKDIKFSPPISSDGRLKYKVIPRGRSQTSSMAIHFYLDALSSLSHHFIYRFDEKIDLCDVIITTQSSSFIEEEVDEVTRKFANLQA